MNKIIWVLILLSASACTGKHKPVIGITLREEFVKAVPSINSDSLAVDLINSSIEWKATEMRGVKQRTGKLAFKAGHLFREKNMPVAGRFIADMESIEVTDMPVSEKTARKNLIAHLKDEDFFNTASYPVATFEITHVAKEQHNTYVIQGNLSIRDVTRSISFSVMHENNYYLARFSFNRFLWNIAYTGSFLNKTLIDQEVELVIKIVLQQ